MEKDCIMFLTIDRQCVFRYSGLFKHLRRFMKPLVVVIIGFVHPPGKKIRETFFIFIDISTFILFRISIDDDLDLSFFAEVGNVDAIACPASVRIKNITYHIPEPFVFHLFRQMSVSEDI